MGETTDQIEAHIENTREELGSNLHELERKVKSVTDWRQHYRTRPMTLIGVAFGAGVLLAAMSGKSRHHRYSQRRFSSDVGSSSMQSGGNRQNSKMMETVNNVKTALVGVGISRLKDFVGDLVPGFQEHYDRAQNTHAMQR